jgi:hypothetical protein
MNEHNCFLTIWRPLLSVYIGPRAHVSLDRNTSIISLFRFQVMRSDSRWTRATAFVSFLHCTNPGKMDVRASREVQLRTVFQEVSLERQEGNESTLKDEVHKLLLPICAGDKRAFSYNCKPCPLRYHRYAEMTVR